jgi:hypothetical protein
MEVTHAEAFEPMAPGNPFGDAMSASGKYVVGLHDARQRSPSDGQHRAGQFVLVNHVAPLQRACARVLLSVSASPLEMVVAVRQTRG